MYSGPKNPNAHNSSITGAMRLKQAPLRTYPRTLTIGSHLHAVNPQSCVSFLDLLGLDVGQRLNRIQSRVLCQCHGSGLQGIGKCSHCVLLKRGDLGMGEWKFRSTDCGIGEWKNGNRKTSKCVIFHMIVTFLMARKVFITFSLNWRRPHPPCLLPWRPRAHRLFQQPRPRTPHGCWSPGYGSHTKHHGDCAWPLL